MIIFSQSYVITKSRGRIALAAHVLEAGGDLQVNLHGGAAHIGGIALAAPDGQCQGAGLPGHREADLAKALARKLALGLNRAVAVSAGIHYDGITAAEIAAVLDLSDIIAREIMQTCKAHLLEKKPC